MLTRTELQYTRLGAATRRWYGSIGAALEQLQIRSWPQTSKSPALPRQELLRELHNRRRQGESLRMTDVQREQPRLMRAALKHFGSWSSALRFAGLRAITFERWDDARVIEQILALHRDGAPLTRSQAPPKLVAAAEAHCGGWKAAVEKAGLDADAIPAPRGPRPQWTQAKVIEIMRASANSGRKGVGPNGFVTAGVADHAHRLFGSLDAAIIAAGIDPASVQRRKFRTNEELAEELKQLARDKPDMTFGELYRLSVGQVAMVRFGKLEAALQALGVHDWPRRRNVLLPSREEVLQGLADRHARGQPTSQNAVGCDEPRLGKPAFKHFGNWRAAMTAAGLGALVGPCNDQDAARRSEEGEHTA